MHVCVFSVLFFFSRVGIFFCGFKGKSKGELLFCPRKKDKPKKVDVLFGMRGVDLSQEAELLDSMESVQAGLI